MNLKDIRKSKGISQIEAAKILGVPIRTYKRYELEEKYRENVKYKYFCNSLSNAKCSGLENKQLKKLKIVVVGIGYVGLATAILLSKKANVKLIDINRNKVEKINNHISPIDNSELKSIVSRSNLKATLNTSSYKDADVVIIATPTNLDETTNKLDTTSVENVVNTIRKINHKCLIVIKSTISIGLTDSLVDLYDDNIIFCPEFLREKHAAKDVFYPSRIILGVNKINNRINDFKNLLESCVKNNEKAMVMRTRDAEAVKLFSNTYLAMRIAFFNELDSYAKMNNLDTQEIINGLGKDARIGDVYNKPSLMYAGYCLPKDTMETATELSGIKNNDLIKSITKSNESRMLFIKDLLIKKAKKIAHKKQNQIVIGIYVKEVESKRVGYKTSSVDTLVESLKKDNIKYKIFTGKNLQHFIKSSDIIFSTKKYSELSDLNEKLFTL